jgi:hypothetical protein
MDFGIFRQDTRSVYWGRRGVAGRFSHRFGGAPQHRGLQPFIGQPLVHQLFLLDTKDTRLGVKLHDVFFYAGVLRCDALTPKQLSKAVDFVVAKRLWDYELDDTGCETAEEYLREWACSPFAQRTPDAGCPAKGCRLHKRVGSLRVFALYQEAEKNARKIWGPIGENLQITYQLCPACGAVLVQNQCT